MEYQPISRRSLSQFDISKMSMISSFFYYVLEMRIFWLCWLIFQAPPSRMQFNMASATTKDKFSNLFLIKIQSQKPFLSLF